MATATLLNLLWSTGYAAVFIATPLAILESGGAAWLLGLAALLYDVSYTLVSPGAGRLGDLGYRTLLVAASAILTLASSGLVALTLYTRDPLYGVAAKLVLGVAGGLATPNVTALIVDAGAGRGHRPEKLLSRYYGSSSTAGWLIGYLGGGLVASWAGLAASQLLAATAAIAATLIALLHPRPPVTLEHSVAAVKARIRLLHERPMRALFPRAKLLARRVARSPLLPFYAAVSTGFAGIGLFFAVLPAYWVEERGIPSSHVMIYAAMHTLVSTIVFLTAHKLVERLGAVDVLAASFAARALVFDEPILTERLLPPVPQAILTYTLTGATWALLNTSLNTLALSLRVGGKGARLGVAQSASSMGLVAGDLASMIASYLLDVRACLAIAALLEAAAAVLTLRLKNLG